MRKDTRRITENVGAMGPGERKDITTTQNEKH